MSFGWSGETSPRWINIQQIVPRASSCPHRKAAGITGFDLGVTKDKGSFHDYFLILPTTPQI
jgi:hypothetical protein